MDSKLIDLLKLLSKKEFNEFGDWLTSPWSHKNKYFLPFYEIIEKAQPKFNTPELAKHSVFKQLYGQKKKYHPGIFNNLILAFTRAVENYLAHLQLNQQETLAQQLTCQELLDRNNIDYFEENSYRLIKELEQKDGLSTFDYWTLHQLHLGIYFQPSTHYRYLPTAPDLVKGDHYLDIFYLLSKFKTLLEVKTRSQILKQIPPKSNTTTTEALANLLSTPLTLPEVELYQMRLQMEPLPDWQQYKKFKKYYKANFEKLHFSFQQIFLFSCINDAVALNSKGVSAIKELLEWYQLGLKHGLLLQNGQLTAITFNNIILTACHEEDLQFLKDFIKKYQKKLPAKIRTTASKWATAHLNYAEGDYGLAISKLKDWLPTNPIYAIQVKATLLKANFKLSLEDDSHALHFESFCLAFEQYIRRNKVYSKDRSNAYLKCVLYCRKICKLFYTPSKNNKWSKLEKAIEKEVNLFGKDWLKGEIKKIK